MIQVPLPACPEMLASRHHRPRLRIVSGPILPRQIRRPSAFERSVGAFEIIMSDHCDIRLYATYFAVPFVLVAAFRFVEGLRGARTLSGFVTASMRMRTAMHLLGSIPSPPALPWIASRRAKPVPPQEDTPS